MNAKEYLSQAFYLNRQIKAKERKLKWLKSITPAPTMKYGEEGKGGADPRRSLVEYAALSVVDLENEIAADILHLVDTIREIGEVIRKVEPEDCRTILEMRYLSFMDWNEIIDMMGRGDSYVFRKHREGLRQIAFC